MTMAQQKKISVNDGDYLRTSGNNHTSARTRAFSYEEIMLRRRNRKTAEGLTSSSKTIESRFVTESGGRNDQEKTFKETIADRRTDDVFSENKLGPGKLKDKKFEDLKSQKEKATSKSSYDSSQVKEDDRSKTKNMKEPRKRIIEDSLVKSKHKLRYDEYPREYRDKKLDSRKERHRKSTEDLSVRRETKDRRKNYRYEEQNSKRRRSRSREHDRGRVESPPRSLKEHKRSSLGRDYDEPSTQSLKDSAEKRVQKTNKSRTSENTHHESGLGGYSPRKRKPTNSKLTSPSSPTKKEAKWDLPPSGVSLPTSSSLPGSVSSSSNHKAYIQPASILDNSVLLKSVGSSSITAPTVLPASIDAVHLTQATRSMRRLYMENLPSSATDKSILSSLNDFLIAAGANRIPGSQPCIACIINKEKSQAVVEFLTPEDATTALSFDGRSMSGTVLKFRRPKDFTDATTTTTSATATVSITTPPPPTTSVLQKPSSTSPITSVVSDSLHKIFIGGVSDFLSSDMLLEIVSAFGTVKAFHFSLGTELNQSCAFVEFVDHSVTHKACTGLNGLKLGGNVITVVRALLEGDAAEGNSETPSYRVPKHALPLLEKPTKVLSLKNLLDEESFLRLSTTELEDVLEDVRVECSRFGSVKTTNFVPFPSPKTPTISSQSLKSEEDGPMGLSKPIKEPSEKLPFGIGDSPATEHIINEEEDGNTTISEAASEDLSTMKSTIQETVQRDILKCDDQNHQEFEPGCVLVEFLREEAACAAAHCLSGRLFDGRMVVAGYAPHDVYLARFPR